MKRSFKTDLLESEEAFDRALQQFDEESKHVFEGLDSESDRGVALISGAYFETILGRCLSVYMVAAPSTDELLSSSAGLGNFSARMSCCLALRIIDERQWKALKAIAKIRNNFAHDFMADFESGLLRSHTSELCDLVFQGDDANYFRAQATRKAFTWSCLGLALELQWRPVDMAIFIKNFDEVIPFYVNEEVPRGA